MDYTKIKEAAQAYLPAMTKFLRDLIAIPSESCEEEGVVKRTIAEMEALGFDKAEIDPEGNALGWMGTGEKIIAFDGHIDTVGIGNIANWEHDPYEGYETDDIIYGRGGSDQEGGVVCRSCRMEEDVPVSAAQRLFLEEALQEGSASWVNSPERHAPFGMMRKYVETQLGSRLKSGLMLPDE